MSTTSPNSNIISINNTFCLKCQIKVTYSYSSVSLITTANARIIDDQRISFNDIIDSLSKELQLGNFSISYCEYDNTSSTFIYCGKYPLTDDIYIGYNPNPNEQTVIRVKLRQVIPKENALRMEVNEEDFENIDENKQHNY